MAFMDMFLGKPIDTEGTTWLNRELLDVIYQQSKKIISLHKSVSRIRDINQDVVVRFKFDDIQSVKIREIQNGGWGVVLVKTKEKGNFILTIGIHGKLWLDLETEFDLTYWLHRSSKLLLLGVLVVESAVLSLISVIVGSTATTAGSLVIQRFISKKEKMVWLNEQKLDLYLDLIAILDSLEVRVEAVSNRAGNKVEVTVDTQYLVSVLQNIVSFMDENNGRIFVFVPEKIVADIHKLRGKLYSASKNINNAPDVVAELIDIIKSSKEIAAKLKKNIM